MREIKFRIYNKTEKRMRYLDSIWNMPDPSYDFDEIQQFTGLLDKNGKEIYEGDIVKWEDMGAWYTSDVRYIRSGFYVIRHTSVKDFDMNIELGPLATPDGKIPTFKIIGNIYQNPELIK